VGVILIVIIIIVNLIVEILQVGDVVSNTYLQEELLHYLRRGFAGLCR